MRTPRIALIAMEARNAAKCFVRVPNQPGRWVYTDRCVVEIDCPQCEAAIGEPCIGRHGHYWQDTHYLRRSRWKHMRDSYKHRHIHEDVLPAFPRRHRSNRGK